ncbi:MAG: hypothetical protein RLZZ253_116 [Verrucomicrobiota bacterium]
MNSRNIGSRLPALGAAARASLCVLLLASTLQALTVHVDPAAPAGGTGAESDPFDSLEAARDALRGKGGGEVLLHPGVYSRTEPLVLGPADSGTADRPVVWKSVKPHSAELEGSIRVPKELWEKPGAEDEKRLDPGAKSSIWCLDLAKLGVRHANAYPAKFAGRGGLLDFHANGVRQPLARWPDGFPEKSAFMGEVLERGKIEQKVQTPGRFVSEENRCARWQVDRGVWLEGYWRAPWEPFVIRVAGIDPASRVITFAEALPNGIGSKYAKPPALGNRDEPWWALNLPEEITVPGEWAVDFNSRRLFWFPPNPQAMDSARIADMDGPVLRLNGVRHLRLEGLRVVRGLSHGVELKECHAVEVRGLEVADCGGSGVVVQGGSEDMVRACDIHDTGESGILLMGGNRAKLEPAQHRAENNHIWRVGVYRKTYAPGILIGAEWGGGGGDGSSVGCVVRHNLIHDTPHAGILYGGNDHLIELNEIARTVLTSSDMGAIYTQADWASQGNVVRHNFIHDNPRAIGVYLDDGDSGDRVEGNLFVRNINGPSVCGGHHNIVTGNLVYDCSRFGLYIDARGVARGYDWNSRHAQKLRALPFAEQPWSNRYPLLGKLQESDPRLPSGNQITENVVARCPKPEYRNAKPDELKNTVMEKNLDLANADPGFVDAARHDYRLRPESPVFKAFPGFKPLPFPEMGLMRDEFRPKAVDADGRPR